MRSTLLLLLVPAALAAQRPDTTTDAMRAMPFVDYEPRSTLRVPEHRVTRAKYPFVDVHGHQRIDMTPEQMDRLVGEMDAMNMRVMVNLSGRQGDVLARGVKAYDARHPKRLVVFANLDFRGIGEPGWGERAAAQLERDVKEGGAVGLKIFKNLGMDVTDANGRVPTDDPRLDPVWAKAGQLNIPVLIHTAEPKVFDDPVDRHNERWLELTQFPDRRRDPARYPEWEVLMREQHNVFRRHKGTRFIAAHLDWMGNDLGRLGALLDSMPNVYTELGAVLHELGRQPRTARAFLTKYKDRVMMGKDTYAPAEYHAYFRVFETGDEYFDYYRRRHAFWKMYGLDLPDDVLRSIYYRTALKVIPGIDAKQFPR
jgi:uncharacterized protein